MNDVKIPRAPAFLSREAKKEWKRVIPVLIGEELFKSIDEAALSSYCMHVATFKQAIRALQDENGELVLTYTIVTKNGSEYEQVRPEVAVMDKATKAIKDFTKLFGLTPLARQTLGIQDEEPEEEDDLLD